MTLGMLSDRSRKRHPLSTSRLRRLSRCARPGQATPFRPLLLGEAPDLMLVVGGIDELRWGNADQSGARPCLDVVGPPIANSVGEHEVVKSQILKCEIGDADNGLSHVTAPPERPTEPEAPVLRPSWPPEVDGAYEAVHALEVQAPYPAIPSLNGKHLIADERPDTILGIRPRNDRGEMTDHLVINEVPLIGFDVRLSDAAQREPLGEQLGYEGLVIHRSAFPGSSCGVTGQEQPEVGIDDPTYAH